MGAAQEAEGGLVADVPPAGTPTLTSMALLDGKVALVSGAGPGLGRDIALACGRQGATVVVAARTEARVEAIAAELEGFGAKALALRLDVCDPDSCRAAVERVVETFGRLEVLRGVDLEVDRGTVTCVTWARPVQGGLQSGRKVHTTRMRAVGP